MHKGRSSIKRVFVVSFTHASVGKTVVETVNIRHHLRFSSNVTQSLKFVVVINYSMIIRSIFMTPQFYVEATNI